MVENAVIKNVEAQIYDDEQIKRLTAFFSDKSYKALEGEIITYQQDEWIVIKEQHNNDGTSSSGFDGAVYLNKTNGQLVVAFRGTEFTADERGYRDAIKNDVLGFGYNQEPKQYKDAKTLLDWAITELNKGKYSFDGQEYNLSNLIITGHSLGGGLAQLIGAQEAYKQYEVHTFNAIGVAQMVDNLSKQDGFNFSGDYSNITNHVISRDFVSTIYDHLGKVEIYKPSSENRLTTSDYIPFNFSKKGNGILGTIFPALGKAFKGHTITNFTDTSSFEKEDSSITFQSLCSILRKLKGGVVTEEAIAPLLTPIIGIGFGGAYTGNKLYNKIFKTGTSTGGAAGIEDPSPTLVGGVSMIDTPEEYDETCQVFVDNDFSFVGKLIDAEGNITFYVDDTANSISALNQIVSDNQYFEIYNNGQELIYNKNQDADVVYIYQDNATVAQVRSQINNIQDLHIAILNQQANGDSTIIGDQQGNLLEGNIGRNIIYGGLKSDIIDGKEGNDSLFGGAGNDEYRFVTGDGQDILYDTDEKITSIKDIVYKVKDGRVNINSNILTGGSYDDITGQYKSNDAGVSYTWSGLNGTDLLISYGVNDTVTVKNFNNGDLGILFDKSKTNNLEDIANQLKRDKQVQADRYAKDNSYATKDVSLTYVDEAGVEHTIVDCEKTSKILNGYGEVVAGAALDTTETFMILDSTNNKITLKQNPVDYSSLVTEMKNLTNGVEGKREDLAIQGSNIYIPTSSKDGSPTLENIYYQYTTKPSGGGFLAGLFTVVQLAACLATGQWLGAAFVALNSGIAGNKVSKISSIVDSVVTAATLAYSGIKGLNAIFTNKSHGVLTGAANAVDDVHIPSVWLNNDGSYLVDGIKYNSDGVVVTRKLNPIKKIVGFLEYNDNSSATFKLSATKWGSSDKSLLVQNSVGVLNFFDLIVNKNTNSNNKYSQNYNVNTSTGSISGSVNIETSNLLAPDYSTPEDTPKFELAVDRGCPLILDLGDDGIETLDIDETNIYFDTQNTGFATKTGWVSKNEGFLVVDNNNDGKITQQSEMFGSETKSGFEDLNAYDSNNDGVINSLDTKFNELKIWQDLNENGITDEGELKSLEQVGIDSIGLNVIDLNLEHNQNTITGMSTYTTTDGNTHNIYNVNFAFNKIYTQYTGTYELSLDVLDMPWLRGYGLVKDLQLKMSEDESFKSYVKNLASMNDSKQIYDKMDEFLAKWIGCEDIDVAAEQNGINSRELAILNKYLNLGLEGEISADKKVFMDHAYQGLKNKIYANFIAQTELGNAFEINYDYKTDSMLYNDNTYEKLITNLPNQKNFYASYIIARVLNDAGSLDGNKLAYTITQKGFGASLISYLNSGFQILDTGEVKVLTPNTPMYVIGTSGNDTITGTDNADIIYGMDGDDILIGGAGDDYLSGGSGNDILIGGDGNDILDGGTGDDRLEGGYGNDTYIYDGQGKDTVIDERWVKIARQEWYQSGWWIFKRWKSRWVYQDQLVDAGNDTVIFGDNIQEKDVQISRRGDDLIFKLKNSDDKLTIKNWYSTSEQRVENFIFADGFVINHKQIMNSITDKSGNDVIIGTNDDNFIISTSGNDTINAKKGNDAIINYEGDTTYVYNNGDGDDIIIDNQGRDKIKFGSGITIANIKYLRNNKDLIISINNMEDTITVLNWFISDDNKIEIIEFSDGTIHTPIDVSNTLCSTIATGYDDVIVGNEEDNILDGLSGNDYIEGRGGNDTLIGGLGKDIMKGGLGDDIYYVDNLGDQVIENENEGNDTVRTAISYELLDNVENLELIGTGNINGVGNELDNTIIGNSGNNILYGKSGTNTLKGGKGDDTYIIDENTQNDVIIENAKEGTDTVLSSVSYTLNAANVENLELTGEDNINGMGNSLDNYIAGNKGNNTLSGGAGNDTLYGGGGTDILKGGTGNDTYIVDSNTVTVTENSSEGTDTVIASVDYTLTANVENLKLSATKGIKGTGNELNNVITGNNQNNTFVGGKGNDTLKGGAGADTYIFNKGDGQDVIVENSPNSTTIDKIVFGTGIAKSDVTFTRNGYDLVVAIKDTSDKITIKNSNLAFGSRIERFEFADGSYIDGNSLYTLTTTSSNPNLYSDVSYLNINSKASAIDREYYDEGGLKTETTYSDQAKISSKKFYDESGVLIQENTYNASGLIIKEVHYKSANVIDTQKEYTYNSNNKVTQVKNYIGTGVDNTEKYTYNSVGLKTKTVIYKGTTSTVLNQIKFIYNSSNKLSTETKYKNTSSTIIDKTSYSYDTTGHITRKLCQIGYNKADPKLSGMTYTWTLGTDNDTKYTYDSTGRLTREVTESGYSEPVSKTVGTVTYHYGEWKTRKSKQVNYTYDTNGRITSKKTDVGYSKPNPTSKGMEYTWAMRSDEDISYSYNANGKITKEITKGAYTETVSKTVGGTTYTYGEWHMHNVKEIAYAYNAIDDITSITTTVGYNKPNPTSKGMQYTWSTRTKEKLTYSYNTNHQLSSVTTVSGYTETVSKTVGGVKYTYGEWKTRTSGKIEYTYNSDCRITGEKVYKYHYNDKNVWTSYLVEQKTYKYDSEGRLILAEHFNNSKLVESIKYEYTIDANKYLTKQVIYKGVISSNKVSSYTKYQEVTINSYYDKLVGNASNNTLNGSNQSDNIQGGAGNDVLYGNAGNDIINGGAGADLMVGGIGDDTYVVDNASDVIIEHANQGADTVQTTLDNYALGTNLENLTLLGSANLVGKGNSYNNILIGNSGNNTLYGYAGNDVIDGGTGGDAMYGGAGDDIYYIDNTDDKAIENTNEGNDTVISSINYTLAANIENLYLSPEVGAINGTGNSLDNKIIGNDANNILDGKGGKNILVGGKGDDIYIINAANSSDVITEYYDEGIDTVKSSITYSLANTYNVENLILTGTDNINGIGNELDNYITGNSANNILRGGEGNDTLYGGGGSDTLYGGKGNDKYIIDNTYTIVNELEDEGIDTVISNISYTLSDNVENLELIGSEDLNATGNDLNNVIKGNSGNNTFEGKKGNDTFFGYEGNDTYIFNRGDGIDTIYEKGSHSQYNDILKFGEGITVDDVKFIKDGKDLVVSIIDSGDKVILKNSNINEDCRIEKFVFADGTIIDGDSFYELNVNRNYKDASAEFSIGSNAISSSSKRTVDRYGNMDGEYYYDEQGNLIEEVKYSYNLSKSKSIDETGKPIYSYKYEKLSNKILYTYDEENRLLTKKDGDNISYYTYKVINGNNCQIETVYYMDTDLLETITNAYNNDGLLIKKTIVNEEARKNGERETYIIYTYDDSNKLTLEQVKKTIYNDSGSAIIYNMSKTAYTYHTNGDLNMADTTSWYRKYSHNRTYTSDQVVYKYNSIGQISSEIYFTGYYNETPEEDGTVTLTYVRYKDVVSFSYNSLNKLAAKTTQSGYYDTEKKAWNLHISEKTTYQYDDNTGLLISETVEKGSLIDDTWTTKTSEMYTYEYNTACMLSKITCVDYTLNSEGIEFQRIENTYDEKSGRLILTNTYIQNNIYESIKYDYIYNDDGILIAQKIYNGLIINNEIKDYIFNQEVAINSYNNLIYGDGNNNTIYGGPQDDYLVGGAGCDILYGGSGNDILDGGTSRDVMIGGLGDDVYYVGNATDKVVELENEGIDTIISDITYTLPVNIENLTLVGSRENINGIGNKLDNVIIGSSTNNNLYGYDGNDILRGDEGNDSLLGGNGDDTYLFELNDGQDSITDTNGKDNVIFGDSINKNNVAIYQEGNDLIIDYGTILGIDRITITNQYLTNNAIEKIELSDGSYISNNDINQIIQNMTAYAQNNSIEFTGIESVKNNADLMNIIASSWHS